MCVRLKHTSIKFRMFCSFIHYNFIAGPGMMTQSQTTCSDCSGEGEIIPAKDRCKSCNGKKVVEGSSVLEVHVNKGELLLYKCLLFDP
jgi:hypothetical protein